MTQHAEPQSQRLQVAISNAVAEREALAVLLVDLHAEQRKLAAVRTIGALSDAQVARLQEVATEIADKEARHAELGEAIAGARDLLTAALEDERVAVEGQAWDAAAAKLNAAVDAAAHAYRAVAEAGARYAECERLMGEAYRAVTRVVRPAALIHLQPPDLRGYFGMTLKSSGGPDYGVHVWHLDRFKPPPPLDTVVAEHAARFIARRSER